MLPRLRFAAAVLLLAMACDAETRPRDGGEGRGSTAAQHRAVPPGSCQTAQDDLCGGHGTGACWCDEACVGFGDCCADAGEVCGLDVPAPEPEPEFEPEPSDDVPDLEYCAAAAGWDPQWRALEDEIVARTNEVRAAGADCGAAGSFAPAPPLVADPALRCAARVHAIDMDARDFFAHTNPDGEQPWDRMTHAGYAWQTVGENLAGGNATAEATMGQWLDSDGHCANLMNPAFTELGVGFVPGGAFETLWVQNFGAPQ